MADRTTVRESQLEQGESTVNRITKIVRRLLAGGVLAGLLLSGAVVAEGSANAATTPVLYSANNLPWSASRHPSSFVFGNGGSPYFTDLTWKSWGQRLGLGNRQGLDPEGRVQPEL